jgi:hypothetical protein
LELLHYAFMPRSFNSCSVPHGDTARLTCRTLGLS